MAGRPAVHSSSMKFTTIASAATPASEGSKVLAPRTARMRAYRPGLAEAGMDSEKPRCGLRKSLTFTAPMASATPPKTQRTYVEIPNSRKTLSQAAMNA